MIAVRAKLRADTEQGRERRRLQKISPMIVDTILESGIAFRVGAGVAFKHDRLAGIIRRGRNSVYATSLKVW